jgi:hypothetical protein
VIVLFLSAAMADVPMLDWPLCGRITENPPVGWVETDGCPAGRQETDEPLWSTYGPRGRANPVRSYEWHRTIDIRTPCGTPIFAPADGRVVVSGDHPRYESRLIPLAHETGGGKVFTEFQHLAGMAVDVGDDVIRGQLIGWTGFFRIGKGPTSPLSQACSVPTGAPFLSFEVKHAPDDDPNSAWARDSKHPLAYLPYDDDGAGRLDVQFSTVDVSDPLNPRVMVMVRDPWGGEMDVAAVEVVLKDRRTGQVIPQMGSTNQLGYPVLPTRVDFQQMNFQYSYKNSSAVPWESFASSPYSGEMGASYSADLHLFATHPSDPRVGWFNGVAIYPELRTRRAPDWVSHFRFLTLAGTADPADLCVVAWAEDVRGARSWEASWTVDGNRSSDCEMVFDDDLDGDRYGADVDCDDTDASVNPGAREAVGDGIDNDCNPWTEDVTVP